MKSIKSEKGMTLVLVLLTIVVFSVIGLAVVGSSINNMKQVKKSETVIQTTDIAEMGVQDYQSRLSNFFTEQVNIKKLRYYYIITDDYKAKNTITDEIIKEYRRLLVADILDTFKLQADLYPSSSNGYSEEIPVDDTTNSYYKIKVDKTNPDIVIKCTTCEANTNDGKVQLEVQYESFGYYDNNQEKNLKGKFAFSFTIDKSKIEKIITESSEYSGDFTRFIPRPIDLDPCSPIDSGKDFVGLNCQFDQKINIDKPVISGATLIFDGGVSFNKINQGIMNATTLYINGDTTVDSHINGIDDSFIYINGTANLGMVNQGIHDSVIVIIGTAKFKDQIKGLTGTTIYVDGTADFSDIDLNKSDSTAVFCVKGEIIPPSGKKSKDIPNIYTPSDTEFTDKCYRTITEKNPDLNFLEDFLNSMNTLSPEIIY
ncbi:hypothetical protein [Neobacillus sp. Marseille-QA0830]